MAIPARRLFSSSASLIWNRICRAFSDTESLNDAIRSKLWMSKHNNKKCYSCEVPEGHRRPPKLPNFKGSMDDALHSKHWETFKSWMSKYDKKYESIEEMLYRLGIFRKRLKSIVELNKKYKPQCTFGLNRFSDLTQDELPKGGLSSVKPPDLLDSIGSMDDALRCEDWETFKSWMLKYNKKYGSEDELLFRFGLFRNELKVVEELNKKHHPSIFMVNGLSDFTDDKLPRTYPGSLFLSHFPSLKGMIFKFK